MADQRVRDFARGLLERSEDFAERTSMRRRRIRLGRASVDLAVPEGDSPRFDVIDAFWPSAAAEASFRLTVVDDRHGPLLPPGGLPPDAHFPLGVVAPAMSDPYRVAVDQHTNTISVFEPETGRCATWCRSFAGLPYWAAATPFRLQLSWMADTFEGEFVHGAAIVRGSKAVMLGGPSGSGKSSMSLRAAQAGDRLVSDDFTLYADGTVHAVYTRAKLHREGVDAFGAERLALLPTEDDGEKRIIDLARTDVISVASSAPLSALVLPQLGAEGSVQQVSSGKALLELAPPSLSGLLGGVPKSLPRLRRLVQSVPAFRWVLSGDRDADLRRLEPIWERVSHAHD